MRACGFHRRDQDSPIANQAAVQAVPSVMKTAGFPRVGNSR